MTTELPKWLSDVPIGEWVFVAPPDANPPGFELHQFNGAWAFGEDAWVFDPARNRWLAIGNDPT
jgi:hypothetical protein